MNDKAQLQTQSHRKLSLVPHIKRCLISAARAVQWLCTQPCVHFLVPSLYKHRAQPVTALKSLASSAKR